jgi:hypothetical protein
MHNPFRQEKFSVPGLAMFPFIPFVRESAKTICSRRFLLISSNFTK